MRRGYLFPPCRVNPQETLSQGCIKLGSINITKAPGSLGGGDLPLVVVLVVVVLVLVLVVVIVIENPGEQTDYD